MRRGRARRRGTRDRKPPLPRTRDPSLNLDGPTTEALLDAGIEAAFPLTDFGGLVEIDRGFGSIVVGVPHEVVARIPRTETVARAHIRERELLTRIATRVRVEVPMVVWVASPSPALPWGASAYRWLDGDSPTIPVSADAAFVGDLSAFLVTLHRTPQPLLNGVGLPGPRDLSRARSEAVSMIEPVMRSRLAAMEFSRYQERLSAILGDPRLDDFVPVLRHGDLWWGNVLVEESSRLRAVLDWEHAAIGDPAEDLAAQQYLGDAAAEAVAQAYGELIGGIDAELPRRVAHHFALRQVHGIRRCLDMDDEEELEDEMRKVRDGPLLGDARDG